ncbi:MAG TPA: adenylate/guanylate cyclase domain-containing protein, partial [Abditibacteriaceae bacterium]
MTTKNTANGAGEKTDAARPNRSRAVWPWLGEARWLHFLLLACLMSGVAHGVSQSRWRWTVFLDNLVLDRSFSLRGAAPPQSVAETLPHTKNILIVELPHSVPRPVLAQLVDKLRMAKVVAIDLMLVDHAAELSPTEKTMPAYSAAQREWQGETRALAAAFRRAGNVAIGLWPAQLREADAMTPGHYKVRRIWQKPEEALWQSARYRAHLWVEQDAQDGIVRHVQPFVETEDAAGSTTEKTPSLGLVVAAASRGVAPEKMWREVATRETSDALMLIDYVGGQASFEYETNRVVYENVLSVFEPEDFQGKLVFIGETDFKSKDIFTTPFGDIVGVQIHANSAATMLSKTGPPREVSGWTAMALALLCSVFLIVPLLRLTLWSSLLLAACEIVFVVLGAAVAFCLWHRVIPVSVPILAIVLTYNGIAIYEYGRARATLGKFIGREMVPRTLGLFSHLKLGGQTGEAAAFFCDLRGYSTLSEFLSPEDVTQILNEYTDALVQEVKKHKGRPIDYLGDGVFVLFEPGIAGPQFALRSVEAALAAQRAFGPLQEMW